MNMKNVKKIMLGLIVAMAALSPLACLMPMERPVLELDGKPVYQFTLTADEGGDIPAGLADTISGPYAAGEQIILIAREHEGYEFDRWEARLGHFDDAMKVDAVFTMPARDVEVTAKFVKKA